MYTQTLRVGDDTGSGSRYGGGIVHFSVFNIFGGGGMLDRIGTGSQASRQDWRPSLYNAWGKVTPANYHALYVQ